MTTSIGILTAGGDSPGLNAAIRAIGKAAIRTHGWNVIGFRDGFRGLMQDRYDRLDSEELSGILTIGGTILGTSRVKPHKMDVGGQIMDMTDVMIENCERHHLDALVCIGGGGTQKNALRLAKKGLPIVTLPKTIDNDVWGTDFSLGFDTALGIATEAVDRLHSTAHSHHRIIVVEIMGHNAGWLTLGAGLAGGADVTLIPEIPYDLGQIAESILTRRSAGSTFSIVAVAEGAASRRYREAMAEFQARLDATDDQEVRQQLRDEMVRFRAEERDTTPKLSAALEEHTKLESRVTILGHVQRGGTPSPVDRLLATTLGTAAVDAIAEGERSVMIGVRDGTPMTVPLDDVAGHRRTVPLDHPWIASARRLGVSFGD